jgi:hypothetical protein
LVMLVTPCLAGPLDDASSPIGKIDPQILCRADRQEPTLPSRTEEAACLAKFNDVVARSGDNLTFKLDDGKTKVLTSNTKACKETPIGPCVVYELVAYMPTSRQFVLAVDFYESSFVHLVSRQTGVVTNLEGYPRPSPNGKQFITVAFSDAWEIKNPIAIYSNTDPPKLK